MAVPRCRNCGKKLGGLGADLCHICADVLKRREARQQNHEADKKVAEAERAAERQEEISGNKLRFLTALAQNGGHVERACGEAGVTRTTIGRYRDDDPEFATAWEVIQEINVEKLEAEADRRALGYEVHEPLAYKGELTGDVKVTTQFSDNLLMFRLKALRPEKYRDGAGASKAAQLTDSELDDALAKMMARKRSKSPELATEVES